ncbi:MAG: DUF4838 domain-containing protein [Lentisphaerae bacterium]|nr:DUF4838 domain-containing protein [Lentisphaerota bacterium]
MLTLTRANYILRMFVVGLGMSIAVQARSDDALVLVRDGQPSATIVVSENPRCGVTLAVAELETYVEKMTGVRLPVVSDSASVQGLRVLIGESAATRALGYSNATFEAEEYCVRVSDDTLMILGHDQDIYGEISYEADGVYPGFEWYHEMGTLWGVFDFLERACGVRWYFPGELGLVAPRQATLRVGHIDRQRRPWARHRWVVPRPFPKSLYWYEGLDPVTVADLADRPTANLWWLHLRVRSEPVSFSHAYSAALEEWRETHPEYLAQGYDLDKVHYMQPAFHKPEVLKAVADMAIAHFDKPLEERYTERMWVASPEFFGISPMDNNNWCKSPEARAQFPSEPPDRYWCGYASHHVWDFVNGVARLVAVKHPDKWMGCFAYAKYQEPYEGMTLEPNVAVQLCRPLSRYWHPALMNQHERTLEQWVKLKPQRLYLFDYFLFPQHRHQNLFPGWFPRLVGSDMARMKRIGLRGAYNDISCSAIAGRQWRDKEWVPHFWVNPMLDHINLYIWFKYLDDQSEDVDTLLDEMCDTLYGPAGPSIHEFIDRVERIASCWPNYARTLHNVAHLNGEDSWQHLCPPARLKEFGELMASAHAAAETTEQKARVALFDAGVFQMMQKSSDTWHAANHVLTPENSRPLARDWKLRLDPEKRGEAAAWFLPDLDDADWSTASTHTTLEKQGHENYKHAWYRTRITVPEEWQGRVIQIKLGAVDESFKLWVNGAMAAEFTFDPVDPRSWDRPMWFDISKYMKAGEDGQIALLVENLSGQGGLWKPSHIVADPIQLRDKGEF